MTVVPHGRRSSRDVEISLDTLAVALILVWAAGAAASRFIGVWQGIGSAAVVVGVASALYAPHVVFPLLRSSSARVAMGAGVGLTLILATIALYELALRGPAFLTRGVPPLYLLFRAAEPAWLAAAGLPLIILAEEVAWRGVVLEAISRRLTPVPAAWVTAAVSAAAHAPAGSPTLIALAFGCTLVWSLLRLRTASLIPSLVSHLLWDGFVLVLRPLA